MALKIRLKKRGRKGISVFDCVVVDSRQRRDGRFIEKLGSYNPNLESAKLMLDAQRFYERVTQGAVLSTGMLKDLKGNSDGVLVDVDGGKRTLYGAIQDLELKKREKIRIARRAYRAKKSANKAKLAAAPAAAPKKAAVKKAAVKKAKSAE